MEVEDIVGVPNMKTEKLKNEIFPDEAQSNPHVLPRQKGHLPKNQYLWEEMMDFPRQAANSLSIPSKILYFDLIGVYI